MAYQHPHAQPAGYYQQPGVVPAQFVNAYGQPVQPMMQPIAQSSGVQLVAPPIVSVSQQVYPEDHRLEIDDAEETDGSSSSSSSSDSPAPQPASNNTTLEEEMEIEESCVVEMEEVKQKDSKERSTNKGYVNPDSTASELTIRDENSPPPDARNKSLAKKNKKQANKKPSYGLGRAKCCCCLGAIGCCGLHRCYLGWNLRGFLMWITLGFCIVGQILDYRRLRPLVDRANEGGHRSPCDKRCCCILKILCCLALLLSPV
eukprot:CAMPEP_0177648704 /NCGR_PEP_ID=MMETSP0447-20121125/10970_1 /TAXON_ID=0 /ORGANISM="Stygamoeba regulata, Strain BSH-02190019" /LENGTH=258 /DNA_ID=CAMNT_0019151363 /DNA_START=177 /DNA_END=953 /DNA_ORIENTATION=+